MTGRTKIEWTDRSWNPITGCTRVSPGCAHCYAARLAEGRLRNRYLENADCLSPDRADDPFAVRIWRGRFDHPKAWKTPRMIFVNSLSDLFHVDVPEELIREFLNVMLEADWHVYQILTKRPARAADILSRLPGFGGLPDHIWIGTSIESQRYVYRASHLCSVPAAVRFLSLEPLLGPIELPYREMRSISWVIVGGESGPGARPLELRWIRSLRDQCHSFEVLVPFFVKQLGSAWAKDPTLRALTDIGLPRDSAGGDPDEWPRDLRIREWPGAWRRSQT